MEQIRNAFVVLQTSRTQIAPTRRVHADAVITIAPDELFKLEHYESGLNIYNTGLSKVFGASIIKFSLRTTCTPQLPTKNGHE
jgi:hypothetical protein